jgi:FMN phosphatase YigB (HAD superfamily)
LVIGDSLKNDILPAHSLGIHTVWLAPSATDIPSEVNYHVADLKEMLMFNYS